MAGRLGGTTKGVRQQFAKALEQQEKGDQAGADLQYLQCVATIVSTLLREYSPGAVRLENSERAELYLRASQCLEISEELHADGLAACATRAPRSPTRSLSSASSSGSPVRLTPGVDARPRCATSPAHVLQRPASAGHNRQGSGGEPTTTTPTGAGQTSSFSFLQQAEMHNQHLRRQYEERMSRASSLSEKSDLHLRLLRKCTENQAVAKMRQQSFEREMRARQQRSQEQLELRKQQPVDEPAPPPTSQPNSGDARLITDVRAFDKANRNTAKLYQEASKSNTAAACTLLVEEVFSGGNHPVAVAFRTKKSNLLARFDHDSLEPMKSLKDTSKALLSVLDQTVESVLVCYPGLSHAAEIRTSVRATVEDRLFDSKIWERLLFVSASALAEKERKLKRLIVRARNTTIKDSEVADKFWLGFAEGSGDSDPYESAIAQFRDLSQARLPSAMLESACQTTRLICKSVEAYYEPLGKKVVVGCDDLLPILCHTILQSQNKAIVHYLYFMEELIEESLLMGENGYTLATVQTAVEYLISLDKTEEQEAAAAAEEEEEHGGSESGADGGSGHSLRDVSLQEVEESTDNEVALPASLEDVAEDDTEAETALQDLQEEEEGVAVEEGVVGGPDAACGAPEPRPASRADEEEEEEEDAAFLDDVLEALEDVTPA